MSDPDAVLGLARALLFVREDPPNTNHGQAVEAFLAAVGLSAGNPWCAAFVSYCGAAMLGSRWLLPMTGSCAALGVAAGAKGWLNATPEVGLIFLLYEDKLKRFGHTGFIAGPAVANAWPTIEGNTSGGGSREGWGAFARHRTFGPKDRFIRWWS